MAALVLTNGINAGRRLELASEEIVIGRSVGLPLTLEGSNVSRRHARIFHEGGHHLVEDLGSSNGTYLNDKRLTTRVVLAPQDIIRIGPYTLLFDAEVLPKPDLTIRTQTIALAENNELYRDNPAQTLQAVLELAHHLANTLETEPLIERFVDQVVKLFPKADRAMVLSLEHNEPAVRVIRNLHSFPEPPHIFSKSVLRQVKEKGNSVLAQDTAVFEANVSLNAMGIRSLICVPLRVPGSPVFGAVQLDRFRAGAEFSSADLYLLTAIALQVSLVLEKARLHSALLARERMAQEITLAREIQFAFLPKEAPALGGNKLADLCAELYPATEVSGDFYDFIALDETRLALVVGDVSGKGMPAALFMAMVRALLRHIARQGDCPAAILRRLNHALSRDNPTFLFVTLVLAIYDSASGECVLARAGHPLPLLKKADGSVAEVGAHPGCLLGIESPCPTLEASSVRLQPGEAILFYTDGLSEAARIDRQELFGVTRLKQSFAQLVPTAPLKDWTAALKRDIESFCAPDGPQDDMTILLLRHG